MSNSGGAVHHRGADGATAAGQCSCPSLISRASPDLWPRGAEISFCHTIDHCKTTLYYTVLYLDLAPRRRYCGLFTLLYRPGSLPGAQTLTVGCSVIAKPGLRLEPVGQKEDAGLQGASLEREVSLNEDNKLKEEERTTALLDTKGRAAAPPIHAILAGHCCE
jgi:hypothetical protein